LQLGQFNLKFTFVTFRALRKNIEDQAVAIDDTGFQRLFEIALLARRQDVIKNHEFDAVGHDGLFEFFDFAAADEHLGIRT